MNRIVNKGKPFNVPAWAIKKINCRGSEMINGRMALKFQFGTENKKVGQFILELDQIAVKQIQKAMEAPDAR